MKDLSWSVYARKLLLKFNSLFVTPYALANPPFVMVMYESRPVPSLWYLVTTACITGFGWAVAGLLTLRELGLIPG